MSYNDNDNLASTSSNRRTKQSIDFKQSMEQCLNRQGIYRNEDGRFDVEKIVASMYDGHTTLEPAFMFFAMCDNDELDELVEEMRRFSTYDNMRNELKQRRYQSFCGCGITGFNLLVEEANKRVRTYIELAEKNKSLTKDEKKELYDAPTYESLRAFGYPDRYAKLAEQYIADNLRMEDGM